MSVDTVLAYVVWYSTVACVFAVVVAVWVWGLAARAGRARLAAGALGAAVTAAAGAALAWPFFALVGGVLS